MKQRDYQLDAYRALVMIYILCIIHTVYWLDYPYEPIKSLILFEMPVIFFISGAAVYLKPTEDSTLSIIKNRFKRVILPYIIYALTALSIIAVGSAFSVSGYDITALTLNDLNGILLAKRIPQIPYIRHLWFILPYFILLCTFHFQTRIIDRLKIKWLYLAVAVAAFITVTFLTQERTIRSCFCYNCFLISGYLYYKRMKVSTLLAIAFTSMGLLVAWKFYGGNIAPMQSHKFPPDIIFLIFGAMTLASLSVIFTYIRIPASPIITRWNKYGYTIYLYQNYSYIIATTLLPLVLPGKSLIILLATALFIFVISTLTSYIFVPFESKVSDWLRGSTVYVFNNLSRKCQ